jgi:site-specific DNA recombinase
LDSLLSTFQNQALVHKAVADFLARANASRPQHHEQLVAVAAEIRRTEVALDRYFQAFESGKMVENQCASRIQALSERLQGLKGRQLELSDAIESQPVMGPTPAALEALRDTIRTSIASGPDTQRKALLQDLVAEVRVQSRRAIVPVFRLPLKGPAEPAGAVRELFRMVGRGGLEPPTSAVDGPQRCSRRVGIRRLRRCYQARRKLY